MVGKKETIKNRVLDGGVGVGRGFGDVDAAKAQLGFGMLPSLGEVTCLKVTTTG